MPSLLPPFLKGGGAALCRDGGLYGQRSAITPPLRKGGWADEFYETAKVGYILNRAAFFTGFKIRQDVLYIPL